MNNRFLKGLRHGLPIAVGYLSVSFPFGMDCIRQGLTPLQATLISLCNMTSAGQFAGLPLMVAQASLMEMALTQLVINLRYALMGLSLTQKLGPTMNTLRRMIYSFANTDEIFAVAASQPEKLHHHYLYGLMLGPIIGWSMGTLLGAVAAQLLPEFLRSALGIAIYGMFLAIVLPPARKSRAVCMVALAAALFSLLFHFVPLLSGVGGGFVIIICAVAAAALGAALFPLKEGAGKEADA